MLNLAIRCANILGIDCLAISNLIFHSNLPYPSGCVHGISVEPEQDLTSSKEDGQKLLDFRGRFDSGYGETSTSGIPGMKRGS